MWYQTHLLSPFLLKGVTCTAQINHWMNILKTKSYRYLVIFTMSESTWDQKVARQEARQVHSLFFFSTFLFFFSLFSFSNTVLLRPDAMCLNIKHIYLDVPKGKDMKNIPRIKSFKYQMCFKQACIALISAFSRYRYQKIEGLLWNNHIIQEVVLQ